MMQTKKKKNAMKGNTYLPMKKKKINVKNEVHKDDSKPRTS
jgi:ribosomal protein S10